MTLQALSYLISIYLTIKELEITELFDLDTKLSIYFLAILVIAIDE